MESSTQNDAEDKYFSPKEIRKIVDIPVIAWPTILLILIACSVEVYATILLYQYRISRWMALFINTIAIFAAFTPMHDAAHGSVAGRDYRYINTAVGYLSSWCFPVPFPAFRHLHLMHHRYTNDSPDPDLWAGSGPWYLLPLKWFTIEYNYYSIYLPNLGARPLGEALASMTQLAAMIVIVTMLTMKGYGELCFFAWILPGRCALFFLAYFFDYLPHRPHDVPRKESIYRSTHVTSLVGKWTSPLTWPLLQQNYHNIHHLVPFIPFYQYATVWHGMKDVLMAKGTRIIPVMSLGVEETSKTH